MYQPKYTISNNILKNIGTIEACREVVENAPIIPGYERQFREDALIRTVHHGTHIEGDDLSLDQAGKVITGAGSETQAEVVAEKVNVVARERDIQEIINYRAVMLLVDKLFQDHRGQELKYTEAQVKELHKQAVHRIVAEELAGEYRKTQVVLRDSRTNEITFRPTPALEVPYLMEDFLSWLNNNQARDIHPVIRAAVAHYALAAIHPFVEGNGRTARAYATLIMFIEGYDIKRLFALEEYFDRDAESYYTALIETSNQSRELNERDLTGWIEYFTHGLSIELVRVRDKVRKLSVDARIKTKRGQQVLLSDRQIRIAEYLSDNQRASMSDLRSVFSMISEDTVLRELQDLVKKKILRKKGKTKGAYYELVT